MNISLKQVDGDYLGIDETSAVPSPGDIYPRAGRMWRVIRVTCDERDGDVPHVTIQEVQAHEALRENGIRPWALRVRVLRRFRAALAAYYRGDGPRPMLHADDIKRVGTPHIGTWPTLAEDER